jgi:hypothetical protein
MLSDAPMKQEPSADASRSAAGTTSSTRPKRAIGSSTFSRLRQSAGRPRSSGVSIGPGLVELTVIPSRELVGERLDEAHDAGLRGAIMGYDQGALVREEIGDGVADATAGIGDDRDPPGERRARAGSTSCPSVQASS